MATKTKKSETADLKDQIDKTAKLFDVAQPGKTPATATSRPVIVGHTAGIKRDPMVVEEKPKPAKKTVEPAKPKDTPSKEDDEPALMVKSKVIKPLSSPEPKPAEKPEQPVEQPVEEPKKEEPAPVSTEPKAPVDTLMSQIDSKQADKQQKHDLAAKSQEVESLIASQKYFVPIGLASKRRSHRRMIAFLFLLLVLILVGLNFAIDAEVVDVGIEALTNIL